MQPRGRLHGGLIGVRAGDHDQLQVLAGFLGQRHHFREYGGFRVGEDLAGFERVLAGGGLGHAAHGKRHDVHLARVGLFQNAGQVLQAIGIADRDEHVARPHLNRLGRYILARVQLELLHFVGRAGLALAVVDFGEFEDREKNDSEAGAGNGGHLLGEHVNNGEGKQGQRDHRQAHGDFDAADAEVERHFPFAGAGLLVAQHQDREGLHGEAPDHAEGIGFAEHVHVAAADDDGDQLQRHDQVDESRGGAELVVGAAEPVGKHAILRHAVEHAVRSDDGGVHGAGENQGAHQHHEGMKQQPGH